MLKALKIFLVDDDLFNITLTQQHLSTLGYTDITAYLNGTECLNKLTEKPQIVFLDHNMDDINGFEILKKIKRFDPNIYVVMLSGQESMETAVNSLKYGAFDYIIKSEESFGRITDVMTRITQIQDLLERSKPSIWKKISSFI